VKWGGGEHPKTINNLISLNSVGSYDLLAKRQGRRPLSNISSSLTVRPIDRSEFDFGFVHDPYTGTLRSLTASTGLAFNGVSREAADSILQMSDEPGEAAVREGNYLSPEGLTSTSLPWRVGVQIGYHGNRDDLPGSPTFGQWSSQATMNGSAAFNFSRNWRFEYSAQYEMRSRLLNSQLLTVKREFHCWEAQFIRSISGNTQEYYFKINVKLLPEVYYEQGSRGLRSFGGPSSLF
jgi:hypothetical protein